MLRNNERNKERKILSRKDAQEETHARVDNKRKKEREKERNKVKKEREKERKKR